MSETIQTKRCSKCKQIKELSDFYKDRSHKDGYCSECKICNLKKQEKYHRTEKGKAASSRYQHSEKYKIAEKRYQQSEKGRIANRKRVKNYRQTEKGKKTYYEARQRYYKSEKYKAYYKKWCLKHRNQRNAKNAVYLAIKQGNLTPANILSCHYCDQPAKEYHHWHGYEPEHWLDVIPVCKKCHSIHISPKKSVLPVATTA